jgi:hypothetical protein
MRGLRGSRFAAGDAGKLSDKGQVLCVPPEIRLGLAARHYARDAGCGHELRHKFNEVWSLGSAPTREIVATTVPDAAGRCPDETGDIPQPQGLADHGLISTLARSAALSASLLGGIGSSFVARIFSITRSMK